MLKDVLKNLKQHCMSGISYMIPVIVIGGFCTALARLAGNVDTAGTIGYAFLQAGNAALSGDGKNIKNPLYLSGAGRGNRTPLGISQCAFYVAG